MDKITGYDQAIDELKKVTFSKVELKILRDKLNRLVNQVKEDLMGRPFDESTLDLVAKAVSFKLESDPNVKSALEGVLANRQVPEVEKEDVLLRSKLGARPGLVKVVIVVKYRKIGVYLHF